MVRAINKSGTISEFSDNAWRLMAPHKNGFVEVSENNEKVVIPDKIVEFQASKKAMNEGNTQPADTTPPPKPEYQDQKETKQGSRAEMDIMKEYLTSKGIKFHHLIGYDKLKSLYDANKE